MSGDDFDGDETGRRPGTALLAVCCLVAVVIAAGALPALSAPLDSSGPGDDVGGPTAGPGESGTDDVGPVSRAVGDAIDAGTADAVDGAVVDESTQIGDDPAYTAADETVHFTVEADRPAYWRTTAYDVYDGDGWHRLADADRYESVPAEGRRASIHQEVTLESSASTVPAAWRPMSAGHADPQRDLELTYDSTNGVQIGGDVGAGDTVVVESSRPVTDPDVLAAAGTDYPDEIEDRYTKLPDDVPDRVHERTATLTADAETPYETATTLETYFRSNYDYDLDVPPPEDDVADELLFERDAAYCAHFATTMTVMLRSEGIPARYAVGYNAGEYDAEADEFVVRGLHAHAWVEVYYPGVGWVPFEPTPADDRAAALDDAASNPAVEPAADSFDHADRTEPPDEDWRESFDDDPDDTADEPEDDGDDSDDATDDGGDDATDDGGDDSSGEDPDDGSVDGDDGDGDDDSDDTDGDEGDAEFDVELEGDPVPGTDLTVTVTRGGEPAEDVWVAFDDEPIGRTDAAGQATGEVPFDDELTVTVSETRPSPVVGATAAGSSALGPVPRPGATDPSSAGTTGRPDDVGAPSRTPAAGVRMQDEETVALPTTIEVAIEGQPLPGETVTVVATLEERPVADAAVRLDGERVATTGDDGRATIRVPTADAAIEVERGAASGEASIEPVEPTIEVDAAPLALPGVPATVTATAAETPIAGATVVVDGQAVATTDENGTAAISFPAALSTTVAIEDESRLASTTRRPLANLLGGLALVAGIGAGLRRRVAARQVRRVARAGVALCGRVLTAIVVASRGVDAVLTRLVGVLREARSVAVGVAGWLRRCLSGRPVPAFLAGRREADAASDRSAAGGTPGTTAGSGRPDDRSPAAVIRAAWYRLVAMVPARRPATSTPAELADRAVEAGLPAGAVETVRDAFRALEYGDRAPDASEAERVRGASRELGDRDGER